MAQLVKNPPAMRETWVRSWVGKIPWGREGLPTPVSWLENSMDCTVGSSGKESDTMMEQLWCLFPRPGLSSLSLFRSPSSAHPFPRAVNHASSGLRPPSTTSTGHTEALPLVPSADLGLGLQTWVFTCLPGVPQSLS